MLVSLQSHSEVLNALDSHIQIAAPWLPSSSGTQGDSEGKVFVASVSPQSRASLAATYNISEREAGYMIEQFLSGPDGLRAGGKHGNGFSWVVDTNVAREACLVLGAEEVTESLSSPSSKSEPIRPILTSSCPGWICYAEKTHPHILPHLSRLKSPQALLGTLLKTTLSKALNVPPSRIWHLAVMPCFDKKLEASRSELTASAWSTQEDDGMIRDVDCVITTREILLLASSRDISLPSLPRRPIQREPFPEPTLSTFLFPKHPPRPPTALAASLTGTSGGNLSHLLSTFLALHPGSTLTTSPGRNVDVVEYSIFPPSGTAPTFKAARYYGFRNIQNLVRRLKPTRISRLPGARMKAKPSGVADYAYVEVMACPGGCTNGGGQIKASDAIVDLAPSGPAGREQEKEWLAKVDEAYFSSDEVSRATSTRGDGNEGDEIDGISPRRIHAYMEHWAAFTGFDLERLVKTSYREVESNVGKEQHVVEIAGKSGGGW